MAGLPGFPRRHPVVAFLAVACAYSGGLWFVMIASAGHWVPFRFPANPLGSFGPALAALLLARRSGLASSTSAGVRSLRGRSFAPVPNRGAAIPV